MTSEKMAESILSIYDLGFSYPDGNSVLEDVDLEVMPGERVGLIGPNGAGKTTLFLQICGILKPSNGEVLILGKALMNGAFHPEVGLVFQNPDDQLFCPSVRDDVAFGPRNMGLSRDEVEDRVVEALTAVGALKLADRPPHHLSEGEKRMVSIAGVLAMRPRLVIYDEPSANLDIRSRRRLIQLLQTSNETILIASHDLELILEVCDRVVLIDNGHIVADGNPRDIMGNDQLMEAHGQEKPHSLVPHKEPHKTDS
ncbi:MAG: ABC transporter ATP-binding protein [Dehalococcoidia bacterium]|nr:MAG: ABC transporter ATP-binding protein [Dehalococcoidia bacterium]UCG82427.1 MAG: ABC transporter ATP-binding protein [Dehalococcoidia bacterium]